MNQPNLELPSTASPQQAKTVATLWNTAIHEAAHAVVAVYYGIPVLEACVEGAGKGFICLDKPKLESHLYAPDSRRYMSKQSVMGYAGFIAVHKLKPEVVGSWESGLSDWKLNAAWLWWLWETVLYKRRSSRYPDRKRLLTEAEIEQILARRARRLLLISRHLVHGLFPVIEIVAGVLIENEWLTGDELVMLAGPLIDKFRTNLAARPVAGHNDYEFTVPPDVQRMPRPKSYRILGTKRIRRCPIAKQ